jgi:hypothetical protein
VATVVVGIKAMYVVGIKAMYEVFTAELQPGEAQVALPDPVIHLYWGYALTRVEEMFKETPFPTGVCGAQVEREYVTLHPKKITCPSCRERAKAIRLRFVVS